MPEATSKRLRLRLEFEGSAFCGWQLQSEEQESIKSSIQGCVERALKIYLRSPQRIVVQGCGRTDAGVCAREFYLHFDLPDSVDFTAEHDLEKFRHSLNGILEDGVSVTHCDRVDSSFHALRDVHWKIYEYSIIVRRSKPTIESKTAYWLTDSFENINLNALEEGLKYFQGEHDFSSFVASDHGLLNTIRKIYWTRLKKVCLDPSIRSLQDNVDLQKGVLLHLEFCGEGFLKHQVRSMAGTLVEVAQGKRSAQSIQNLLQSPSPRSHAGFCAPAHGLILKEVSYNEYKDA